jgi:DNA-binding protein HU-beta
MNKSELIDKIADQVQKTSDLKKNQIEEILAQTMSLIKTSVKKGQDVTLIGFGTFTKTKRKARAGRNPKTGEAIKIPAMNLPKFKPGKDFKELIR